MYELNKNKTFIMLTTLIPTWTTIRISIEYFGLANINTIDNLFVGSLVLSSVIAIGHKSDCQTLKVIKIKQKR